jgi:hypothetical protein
MPSWISEIDVEMISVTGDAHVNLALDLRADCLQLEFVDAALMPLFLRAGPNVTAKGAFVSVRRSNCRFKYRTYSARNVLDLTGQVCRTFSIIRSA